MPRMSAKLSPGAKKKMLEGAGTVNAFVEISPAIEPDAALRRFAQAGAMESHGVSKPGWFSVCIPSRQLAALADLEEVVYVDVGKLGL